MSAGINALSNFLVPATGSTNGYVINQTFSATPFVFNPNTVGLDGLPFRPSGVIIDNSQGTGSLTVLINDMSFAIICPAGSAMQMPFPAPMNFTANITGLGVATVIFVDYPVIPIVPGVAAAPIPNPLPITATDPIPVEISGPDPLPVSLPAGTARTSSLTTASAAGTVAAGAVRASFANSGAAAATVAGGSLPTGASVDFSVPDGDTLAAIAYDGTGTTLIISSVV